MPCNLDKKINIHQYDKEFEPKAHLPVPRSLDLCFISEKPLVEIQAHIQLPSIEIIEGPVKWTWATGSIVSIYLRDFDLTLIEISQYLESDSK